PTLRPARLTGWWGPATRPRWPPRSTPHGPPPGPAGPPWDDRPAAWPRAAAGPGITALRITAPGAREETACRTLTAEAAGARSWRPWRPSPRPTSPARSSPSAGGR